jgi:hypothetical protein
MASLFMNFFINQLHSSSFLVVVPRKSLWRFFITRFYISGCKVIFSVSLQVAILSKLYSILPLDSPLKKIHHSNRRDGFFLPLIPNKTISSSIQQ